MKPSKKRIAMIGIAVLAVIAGAAAYFLTYGKYSRISYRIMVNNAVVAACDDAYITDLFPKPHGGFRFHCGNVASVYIVYGTEKNDPAAGTINRVRVWHHQEGWEKTFLPAYHVNSGRLDCPSAKALNRTTGEMALPTTLFGDIRKGRYTLMLAEPCGEMVLEIGRP